jgi:hypothetical protein
MRDPFCTALLAATLVSVGGSACAMKQTSVPNVRCSVVGAELLPPASGGEEGLCRAIERALSNQAAGERFTVEVRVPRRDMLSASVVTSDGRRLPEFNTVISDSTLTPKALDRFASDLAEQVANHIQ